MASEFSFGPNPAYPWGGTGAVMGRALLLGMTNGLNLMDLWEKYRRQAETTPSWVAAQQAQFGALQSHANLQSAQDQSGLGYVFHAAGTSPAAHGYNPNSLTDQAYNAFGAIPSSGPGSVWTPQGTDPSQFAHLNTPDLRPRTNNLMYGDTGADGQDPLFGGFY